MSESSTTACLRIWGDTLVPDEVSSLLGAQPTHARTKDEVTVGKVNGQRYVAKTGTWHFEASSRSPGDLDAQVNEIFAGLSQDSQVWEQLRSRFELDLFCGLFMVESSYGIGLRMENMRLLGERGISMECCVYAPSSDD
ncbi:MAG: DUF4279 domain-containing protein [Lysobacter sp.]|nr:DUF4279 domain-containing protein [Lysobacter sp.]